MKISTALILCAGFGKRLDPLTLKIPKPVLKQKNVTMLETCINTVQSGKMTKDLAILINPDQRWLNTQDFLEVLKENLEKKLET